MAPPSAPPTPTSPFPSSGAPQPSSLSRLTLSDKLLLAQAVHHIGSSPPDWGRVSSILLSHPLIRTKSRLEQASKAGITLGRVFGSRECERAWVALMRQYNLVLQPGEKDIINDSEGESSGSSTLANRAKEARGLPPKTDRASQLALAQFLYAERIREIQESIKIKEQKFKALVADIQALNSGALDEKLAAEVKALNTQATTPSASATSRAPPKDRTPNASVSTAVASTSTGATTLGGPSRPIRPSRSGSSAAPPEEYETSVQPVESSNGAVLASNEDADVTMTDDSSKAQGAEVHREEADSEMQEADTSIHASTAAESFEAQKSPIQGAEDNDRDPSQVPDHFDSVSKQNDVPEVTPSTDSKAKRSSKRKRESDAGLSTAESDTPHDGEANVILKEAETAAGLAAVHEEGNTDDEVPGAEDGEGEEADDDRQRPEPRRSRRSTRGTGVEEEPRPVTPASAVVKGRVGTLRSREASGTLFESEDGAEGPVDADTSRSTAERASRTSLSPVATRKGRGTSRLSSNVGTSRRSRGGSNTSRTEADISEAEREKAKRKNEKVLMMLLNEVSNHTHGNLFHSAIKEQDAPDYYALIRHPVDLKMIKSRIKEGTIVNSVQLRRALNQMFANSLIYNRPGTEIHRMALEMRDAAEEMIDRFEQTQLSASYARR